MKDMARNKNSKAVFVLAFFVLACNDFIYEGVTITPVGAIPDGAYADDEYIRIPVDTELEIEVDIEFEGPYYLIGDYYHLKTRDSGVLNVSPGEDDDRYRLWGNHTGETCLAVNVTGTVRTCIYVEVFGTDRDPDVSVKAPPGCDGVLEFPDERLEAVIKSKAETTSQALVFSDVVGITALNAPRSGISDLTGIRCLTNLSNLALNDNDISDLSPLSGLSNLRVLDLSHNSISDLSPLDRLSELRVLDLEGNSVSVLSPLSRLSNLNDLHLTNNAVSDLSPLSDLNNLRVLDLSSNRIDDLTPLSGLSDMSELNLRNNDISDLSPLDRLANLSDLNLSTNTVSDLTPLSGLSGKTSTG